MSQTETKTMKTEEIKQVKNRLEALKQDLEDDRKLLNSILNRNMTRAILINELETKLSQYDELTNALETITP